MLENNVDYAKFRGSIVHVYQIWNESYRQDDCFAIALVNGTEYRFYLGFDLGYYEPLNRYIDAPKDIIDAWHIARNLKIEEEREEREKQTLRHYIEDCTDFACVDNDKKLYQLYKSSPEWQYILKTLSRATRSKFNLSLKKQVIAWIDNPVYSSPLSPNQYNAMLKWFRG